MNLDETLPEIVRQIPALVVLAWVAHVYFGVEAARQAQSAELVGRLLTILEDACADPALGPR